MAINIFSKEGNTSLNFRNAFRYTHMPEIMPRIRALGQKFGHFAFLLAIIFRSARLLPRQHPMLNPVNIGRFGIRDVIATAANNVVLKRENMDQVMIFGAVVMALIMIVIQAVLIGVYAFVDNAQAGGGAGGGMFSTPSPDTDLAFTFLRNVFGVTGIFGAGSAAGEVMSLPTQTALHAVLGFYSTAMMIVAVLIVIYYVITVVGESAQTGQPFGKRFNGLWAPIRLVLALGLLVPLGSGLNAAQYLTLHMAKFGSGLATQGWIVYVDALGSKNKVTVKHTAPDMKALAFQIFAADACMAVYNQVHDGGSVVRVLTPRGIPAQFNASADGNPAATSSQTITYSWSNDDNVPDTHTCGAIDATIAAPAGSDPTKQAIRNMQISLLTIISQFRTETQDAVAEFVRKYTTAEAADVRDAINEQSAISGPLARAVNNMQSAISTAIDSVAVESSGLQDDLKARMQQDAIQAGWMSAGIYYSQIGRSNREVKSAVLGSLPMVKAGPTGIAANIGSHEGWLSPSSWWNWAYDNTVGRVFSDSDSAVRNALANMGTIEEQAAAGISNSGQRAKLGSGPFRAFAYWFFGEALADLIDNSTLDPLTRMAKVGSDILDKSEIFFYLAVIAETGSIVATVAGMGAGFLGGLGVGGVGAVPGVFVGAGTAFLIIQVLQAASGMLWFLVGLGMAAGVILFYILPMLPFMYFFMAAVSWVIEVFEAFIAMPLWAIAHLRIDGDGLPGQAALAGYQTLFGILLRPILIIFGLIGAMLIFGGGATLLNALYANAILSYRDATGVTGSADLVPNLYGVTNAVTGGDEWQAWAGIGPFGTLVYVLMYVYIMYMLGISCFKLVDTIPDKMLRWIGGPQPFTGDKTLDIGGLQNVAIAGYATAKSFGGATQSIKQQRQQAAGDEVSRRRHQEMIDALRGGGGGTP